MSSTKWIYLVVSIVAFVFVAACERTITTVEETTTPGSCFACHSDANTAIVAAHGQWANSKHASGENIDRNSSTCSRCHTSEGFVRRVNGEPPATIENPTAIHCFTCHAPHTMGVSADSLLLRITEVQTLQNGASYDLGAANLCTACHQSRRNVNTYVAQDTVTMSSHWGPHYSAQADLLLGTNGYEYSFFEYQQLLYHKATTEDGCLDCHFRTTRNYILGGHSFNMAWEVEGGGEEINTEGCNARDECHGGFLEDFNYGFVQRDVDALLDQLEQMLITAKLLKLYDEEGVLEWDPYDRDVLSRDEPGDSAGAVWNYLLALEDRSHGVHNSKYIKGLLQSAIEFLQPAGSASVVSAAAGQDHKAAD